MKIWDEWVELTKKGIFTIQTCKECFNKQFYPRNFCLNCNGKLLSLEPLEKDKAKIFSFTQINRSPNKELFNPPYIIALIEVGDSVKFVCQLDLNLEEVHIGKVVNFKNYSEEGIIYFR